MTALIVLHSFVCLFLVAVILLQPGKGDAGIGFGSSSQSIFGSKGAGNFLTKTTAVCAALFLTTSFVLTKVRMAETGGSVIDNLPAQSDPAKPATPPATDPAAGAKADAPATGTAPAKK